LGGSSPGRVVNSCLPLIYTLEQEAMQEIPAWPSELPYTGVLFCGHQPYDRRITAIIRRRCRCLECGQTRIDNEYA
jgi:hypothetical protein